MDCIRKLRQLKSVELNDKIKKLGDLYFWGTRVRKCKVHQEIGKMPYQLGISAESSKELVLPDGLELVEDEWFANSGLEKVTISATVKELRRGAFAECRNLK